MGQGTQGAGGRSVKLKVQANPRPSDGSGGFDNTSVAWADKFEIWAKMKKSSGREVFANRQTETRNLYKFTMDFPLGGDVVLTTDRLLVDGTRAFNIHSVENVDQRNRELVVIAEEGVPD